MRHSSPLTRTKILVATALLGGAAMASAADISSYDKTFMMKAADAGSTEIAASKIASTKSVAPAVKTFADTMVTEHTKVADELKTLATSKSVTLSDTPSKAHESEIKKLDGLDGKKFDKEYAKKIGVAAHKDTVKLFKEASTKASDPDVKAFAVKTLPGLEHHLQMAEELHTTVKKE